MRELRCGEWPNTILRIGMPGRGQGKHVEGGRREGGGREEEGGGKEGGREEEGGGGKEGGREEGSRQRTYPE